MIKIRKFLAFILCLVIPVSLSACTKDKIVQNGIRVSDNITLYSEETEKFANDAIYDFLYSVADATLLSVSSAKAAKMKTKAAEIEKICAGAGISEDKYKAFFESISERNSELTDAYCKYKKNTSDDSSEKLLKALYEQVIETFGFSAFSGIAYDFVIYGFDTSTEESRQYAENNKSNEQLYSHYKQKYEKLTADRETFINIGEHKFLNLLRDTVMVLNVLEMNEGYIESNVRSFSSSEVIMLFRQMNFDIELNMDEWRVVLEQASSIFGNSARLCKLTVDNGDTEKVGTSMNALFSLLRNMQSELSIEAIEYLQNGDTDGFFGALNTDLSENSKSLAESFFSLRLSGADYYDAIDKNGLREKLGDYACGFSTFAESEANERTKNFKGLIRGIFDVKA